MTAVHESENGFRAYPVLEAFQRLGIGPVKGYELINAGELETYTVGRFRYVTDRALQKFIRKRIRESTLETKRDRLAKVEQALTGRARRRQTVAA